MSPGSPATPRCTRTQSPQPHGTWALVSAPRVLGTEGGCCRSPCDRQCSAWATDAPEARVLSEGPVPWSSATHRDISCSC